MTRSDTRGCLYVGEVRCLPGICFLMHNLTVRVIMCGVFIGADVGVLAGLRQVAGESAA